MMVRWSSKIAIGPFSSPLSAGLVPNASPATSHDIPDELSVLDQSWVSSQPARGTLRGRDCGLCECMNGWMQTCNVKLFECSTLSYKEPRCCRPFCFKMTV